MSDRCQITTVLLNDKDFYKTQVRNGCLSTSGQVTLTSDT